MTTLPPPSPAELEADVASIGGVGRADHQSTGFARYLGGKLLAALVSFLVTLIIGFILFSIMPADPVASLTRGRPTSPEQMAALRESLRRRRPGLAALSAVRLGACCTAISATRGSSASR